MVNETLGETAPPRHRSGLRRWLVEAAYVVCVAAIAGFYTDSTATILLAVLALPMGGPALVGYTWPTACWRRWVEQIRTSAVPVAGALPPVAASPSLRRVARNGSCTPWTSSACSHGRSRGTERGTPADAHREAMDRTQSLANLG